jgi:hypothetical protein
MSDAATPKRPYQPPRLYDVGTADERAFGATVTCGNGGTNSSGLCTQGHGAAPGQCRNGNSAGGGTCHNGNSATGSCGNGARVPRTGALRRR